LFGIIYIIKGQLPVPNFVRSPKELEYCNQPDKWHDLIDHAPLLMDEEFSYLYKRIASLNLRAFDMGGDLLRAKISDINAAITELGLILENGKIKALGATLYSSSGELKQAFSKAPIKANLKELLAYDYDRSDFQGEYFLFDSLQEV